MLATSSQEGGENTGLNLVPGRVVRLDVLGCNLRIPHIGWNEVVFEGVDPLLAHIPLRSDFYFVHSFAFAADSRRDVIATTDYGISVVAVVRRGNVFGTQFHPEKSSKAGRQVLRNFLEYAPC
jgi:imidazole glycerol-phosphate synthase subunit HisH